MNNLKLKLKNGGLAVGTMISEIRNPNLAYMLAQCGFDFFIIDNEHGSYSPETISNMIAAARGAGVLTVVRWIAALQAFWFPRSTPQIRPKRL